MVEKMCVSLHYVKTMRNEERLSPNTLHICESNEIKIYKPFTQKWNMSNDDNEPKNYNNNKKQIVDDIRSGTLLDTWLCVFVCSCECVFATVAVVQMQSTIFSTAFPIHHLVEFHVLVFLSCSCSSSASFLLP